MAHQRYKQLIVLSIALVSLSCSRQDVADKMGVISAAGADIQYSVEGQGIPTVVTCDKELGSRAFSEDLRNHLQLIFMEPRLFTEGFDSALLSGATMDSITADIELVRRHLGIDKLAVLGHSICGVFAVEYAKAYSDHVSHVVMIGTPPGLPADWQSIRAAYWDENASEERKAILRRNFEVVNEDSLARLSTSDAGVARYLRNTPQYWNNPTFDASWLLEGQFWPVEGLAHLVGTIMIDYAYPSPGDIRSPIFLALGRHDYAVPPPLWDGRKEQYPTMDVTVFERSGHFPHFEEHGLFDQTLLNWLARN